MSILITGEYRWIELIIKCIKQNLRFKKFYGTSENAVKSQKYIKLASLFSGGIMQKNKDH